MSVNCNDYFSQGAHLAETTPTPLAAGLEGSMILGIAGEVKALIKSGEDVANFTIGDFNPKYFPVPNKLTELIQQKLSDGQTNYPPAVGLPEIRSAVRSLYKRKLGLDYPEGTVQIGSGARPPIYASFETIVAPGDTVVYPVPTWNIRYYVYLRQAKGVPIVTQPENGFMPTAAQLKPHLSTARMIVLNSPLNPCGTAISKELLTEISEAIVAENNRRKEVGERPLMLMYDQVYWQLTFGETKHFTPVELVPEMANYTILIDAISKSWAATGVRLGWAVAPPWVRDRMRPLVGHMGAWSGRAEQLAAADLMNDAKEADSFITSFKGSISDRLDLLHDGLQQLKGEGFPVDSIAPQGAIYLSAKLNLIGLRLPNGDVLESDDDVRRMLLHTAKIAVVPFTAFGYPENTGWLRLSIGAVTEADITAALKRLRSVLTQVCEATAA
jgi:aspartate aminotransferase